VLVVPPQSSYQIMLGSFSAALLGFGIWWTPILEQTQSSLSLFPRG
jgi:NADH-quinone oxidoreductase subunit N